MSRLHVVFTLAVVALLSACATQERLVVECGGSPRNPLPGGAALTGKEYGAQMSPIPLDAVLFGDKALARKVAVQSLSATRTAGDNVAVTARVVNCSDGPVQLGIRTSFLDEEQRPTEAPSVWRTVFVQPRSTGLYSEVSLGMGEVIHYLVEIRDGAKVN